MSEETLFSFDNLAGGYGSLIVVNGLSGGVDHGQCTCVLGRNGVGKSTLLKLLSGQLPVTSGVIKLKGERLDELSPDERRKKAISYAPQERPVFDNLTVRDNLMLMRDPDSIDDYQPFFDAFPVLGQRLSQFAGTLSGGERKILSFTRTMAEAGTVTLLDEPTEGVQSENIDHMQRFILAAKNVGRSLIVVEQHLHMAEAIADRYLIMDHGQCVVDGSSADITRADILKHIEV